MSIKIFVMTHKQFEAPTDSMYVPLQVGHAISPELGYLADRMIPEIIFPGKTKVSAS